MKLEMTSVEDLPPSIFTAKADSRGRWGST